MKDFQTSKLPNFPHLCHSILIMFGILLYHIDGYSATITVTPSSNPTNQFIVPLPIFSPALTFTNHEIAYGQCTNANNTDKDLVAVAFDGNYAGIVVTDGLYNDYISFTSLLGPGSYFNPDIVLLNDGTRAIATVSDGTECYVVEINITINTTSIVLSPGALATPVSSYPATHSTQARIDSDPNQNRFAIVFAQNQGGPGQQIYYSIYDWLAPSYNVSTFFNSVSATSGLFGSFQFNPDIAIASTLSGDPVTTVVYKEKFSTDVNLKVEQVNSTSPATVLELDIPTNVGTAPTELCGYPRIGGENSATENGGTDMKWAVVNSEVGNNGPTAHLMYVHSDFYYAPWLPNTSFLIDDPYSTSPNYRNLSPSLDMMDGVSADDAFVAWAAMSNSPTADIAGVMFPYVYNTATTPPYYYNTWEEVEHGYTPNQYSTTSVCQDPQLDQYVVSFSVAGNSIIYRKRMNSLTSFKLNTNEGTNQNSVSNIYPNPASNCLNIFLDKPETIQIYDVVGKLVIEKKCQSNLNKLDISELTAGNYILRSESLNYNLSITK